MSLIDRIRGLWRPRLPSSRPFTIEVKDMLRKVKQARALLERSRGTGLTVEAQYAILERLIEVVEALLLVSEVRE